MRLRPTALAHKTTAESQNRPVATHPHEPPPMLTAITASFYRGFLRLLGRWGRDHVHHDPLRPDAAFKARFGAAPTFEEVDRHATRLGEVYRGIGVICGLCGVLVVFLALAPYIFGRPSDLGLTLLKAAETVLMLVIVVLVIVPRRLGMKQEWIIARMYAEELRYQRLARAVQAPYSTDDEAAAVRREVAQLLSDQPGSQVVYHRAKIDHYEAIEAAVKKVTYVCFGLSLLGAFVAVAFSSVELVKYRGANRQVSLGPSLLLFLLVFIPAFVSILHGVVAFLRLPQLIGQHELATQELMTLRLRLADLTHRQAGLPEWKALGSDLLTVLTRGDTAWTGIARHQDVHPV